MKKSFAALLLLAGMAAFLAAPAFASEEAYKLKNAQEVQDRNAARSKLRVQGTADDTVYVGHSTSASAAAPWYIYTGPYFPDQNDPTIPNNQDGYWGFDNFNAGLNDSLMGWWPIRRLNTAFFGTLNDKNRTWGSVDHGNVVNYVLNSRQQDRTFGVNGVWHVDPGAVVTDSTSGTNVQPPNIPANVAWCGLRSHGDLTAMDLAAQGGYNNPFNGDAHMYMNDGGGGAATTKNWPGYGSQWDQLLYRDIVVPAGQSLTISFDYGTAMSTSATLDAATMTGWFDGDARTGTSPNYISASDAVTPPRDSFMVYIGQPVDVNACLYSDGATEPVFDVKRRWKNEVVKRNATKEILSVAGSVTASESQTISAADLAPYRDAAGRVRLCFRVKTNRGFDDTGTAFSSGGAGAAWVDNVVLNHSGTPGVDITSTFSNASEINNIPQADGYATAAWKSTGKPPRAMSHVHPLNGGDIGGGNFYSALSYTELCGPPQSSGRICNIYAVVVSVGDHDNNEAAGGASESFMPGDRETYEGLVSPTINLMSDGTPNEMGITPEIAEISSPDGDYLIWYDIFAGVFNTPFTGNAWNFGFQAYPARQANGSLAWGEIRTPTFIYFNPEPQCYSTFEFGLADDLVVHDGENAYPDSIRIMMGKVQQCHRFAITGGCSPTEGTYYDNLSLAFADPPLLSTNAADVSLGTITVQIWRFLHDAFPKNETQGLPGTAAFDTCGAMVQSGINIAPSPGTLDRFVIPGDSSIVIAGGDSARLDLVFRILPGVGNYVTIGDRNSGLRRVPTSTTAAVAGDGSFFGSYLQDVGEFGSPGGHTGGVWNSNVWNSARMDTAERNMFRVNARGNISNFTPGQYSSTMHESDPKYSTLGILHNVCFLVDTAGSTGHTNITCTTVPPWTALPGKGYDPSTGGMTREGTPIIPHGLLTPGAHVQYFFRKSLIPAPHNQTGFVASPDTNRITPQNTEGSTDGHRFQAFGVLPDRWKDGAFGGLGMACALVVDQNDRRGNERAWISTADSIGANAQAKWGAHNGWHVFPGYVSSTNDQDYTGELVGSDPTIAVWSHGGQAGTNYDFFNVKASESLTTGVGHLGSRLGFRSNPFLLDGKFATQGPTPEMLRTYYRLLVVLTGDLNTGIFGPFVNRSSDDITLITDFLTNSSGSAQPRGIFVQGDGFVQAETSAGGAVPSHLTLLSTYLACSLRDPSYQSLSGNLNKDVADLIPTNIITTNGDIYGVQNSCLWSNDLLFVNGAVPGATAASFYENFGNNGPYVASVYAPSSVTRPWVSMVDGWENEHLRSRYDDTNRGRLAYFFNVFSNVFASICAVQGAPEITLDVPRNNKLSNFMSLANNPVRSGSAQVHLGLANRDFVSVKLFDVAGRQVATLAERYFEPGTHTLTWDGTDNSGRPVARGVYFAQVKFAAQKERFAREIVVLK